jgi:hypothetical protein
MADLGVLDRWVIGGPSRCGKTHLALSLWNQDAKTVGFPLEALFSVYLRRYMPAELLLEEYLTRPRYIDAERDETERPIDYFSSSLEDMKAAVGAAGRLPITTIGWALDRFARDNGRASWAAFDLHPEFRYELFCRQIPQLKLAVMHRDPREAIAAALFWRGHPAMASARDARFRHSLIMYCLGLQVARSLSERHPDRVKLFDFSALVTGDTGERSRIAACFGMSQDAVARAYDISPDFHYDPALGFRLPGGTRSHLLTLDELDEISLLAGPGHRGSAASNGRAGFLRTARAILTLGRSAPNLARAVADAVYYPSRFLRRRANGVRLMAADVGQFASGYLGIGWRGR